MPMWPFRKRLRKRRNRWAGVDFMTLVPARCARVVDKDDGRGRDALRGATSSEIDSEVDSEADVVLLMPRFQGTLFERWLQPRLRPEKRHIRVPLDARGSFLWRRIDGQCEVHALVTGFVDAFPDDSDQADDRVCQYLYYLEQNGFIRFVNLAKSSSANDG